MNQSGCETLKVKSNSKKVLPGTWEYCTSLSTYQKLSSSKF